MVVIDTSVIIDHLRQKGRVETGLDVLWRSPHGEDPAVSVITIQELFRGTSTRHPEIEIAVEETIAGMVKLTLTETIARQAGKLMRDRKPRIEFADAAIAATTLEHRAKLLTLNTKDFAGIPGLEFLKL